MNSNLFDTDPQPESCDIQLKVLGDPRALKRHRTYTHDKDGKALRFPIQVDPSRKEKEEFLVVVQDQAPPQPFDGPIRVDIFWYFPRPTTHYGTGRNAGKLKANAAHWYCSRKRYDRDNLDKFVLDALSGKFFYDDGQVCLGILSKQYAAQPRTEIFITRLRE